jgi:hypothetical protein
MKFKKKPIAIEARQFLISTASEVSEWANMYVTSPNEMSECWWIPTLEGDMKVLPGDWVIQGVKGEFYACRSDIFELTYESAE